MNEWFKRVAARIKELWSKWSLLQKGILIGVIVVAVVLVILLLSLNASPSTVPVINSPITDEAQLRRITNRLDQEGIPYSIGADGRLNAPTRDRAQEARAIIVREDLLPANTDPWNLFDMERWTITDYERNVNLRRAITAQVEQHIESLSDIDNATVSLVLPQRATFSEDQLPTTASVTIIPKPGSGIREDRRAIEGLVKLIQFAIEGLATENITITDETGRILNNFDELTAFDDLELRKRELDLKRRIETDYTNNIKSRLATMFTAARVEIPKIEITLDMGKWTAQKEEFSPIIITPDNPNTPFDETESVLSIERSISNFSETYTGTAFVPQGPPGQEANTPPAFQDLSTLGGEYNRSDSVVNNEINSTSTTETGSPTISKISVSVALDGRWELVYDENGRPVLNNNGSLEREYRPISPEDLQKAQRIVEAAVGYNRGRGDTVVVENLAFDRTAEHAAEDLKYKQERDVQNILLGVMIGLAAILAIFIIVRLAIREGERRRRLREEELARQHQAMREAALRSAEEESAEVEMSVEERARLEMQENAINIAREHPEDVAQLIRTWLLEE